ncbi:hypothetical protein V8E51_013400 [Hyaloscypha variabilis]
MQWPADTPHRLQRGQYKIAVPSSRWFFLKGDSFIKIAASENDLHYILTPLIRRIWHPHHLEQSKIHTTWLIESQLTWVANPAKFALSDGESTLRYSRGTCGAAFPPNSPLGSRDFLCFTGQIVFCAGISAFAVCYQHVSFPKQKNATSRFPRRNILRSVQRCFAHHSQHRWPSARYPYDGDLSFAQHFARATD